jgi:lipoic acid synthetase
MQDLRTVGVDILVLGQYLRPTRENVDVEEYLSLGRFAEWKAKGEALGFAFVGASPLARTSYKAREAFEAATSRPLP